MTWPLEATITLTHDDYTVAWLCALPIEKAAARNMLDELHGTPPQPEHDKNIYTFGRISGHNVVIVCQGDMGTTAASIVATRMDFTFRRLRLGLLVGVAGGVPEERDIRLGDVVISQGDGRSRGVVAHDRGKSTLLGFESRPFLNDVPEVLRNAFRELESRLIDQDSKITTILSEATIRNSSFSAFETPTCLTDDLFQSNYSHVNSKDKTCAACVKTHIVSRPIQTGPRIHFGIVASGNQVVKNAVERARIHKAHPGVLAIEMEAAGLMDVFGCATIRGICDYADSHKNDGWHKYASARAAAVAKEILGIIPVATVVAPSPVAAVDTPLSHFLVPFSRNEHFVGRDRQLEELTIRLNTDQSCRRIAVWGLGGVGKTQIVLEFAHETRKSSPTCSIFWVYAGTSASFESGYADIAECLKLPGRTDHTANVKYLVQSALSQRESGHWILIIDNADDIDVLSKRDDDSGSMALVDYIPNSCTGSIIFTTRTRKAAVSLAKNNMIQVNKMGRDNAMEVLRKTLLQTDLLGDESTVIRLLDILDYLPLAIIQAVSYINKNDISIAEYIELCESSEEDTVEVLSEDFEDEGRYKDIKNPVAATWLISFIQICRQDKLAGEYLSFMACLARQHIPRSLLPAASSKKRATDAIGTLTAYSFITKHKSSDDLFDIHRLVHISIRNWLKQENKWKSWNEKALQQMNAIFPWPTHENRASWMEYLPHAQSIVTSIELLVRVELPWTLMARLAECSREIGNYPKAETMYRQILQLQEKVLEKEHPETLCSRYNVAYLLNQQGKSKEAEAMNRQTLQLQEKVLGKEHRHTLSSMVGLAVSLKQQGKFIEAEAMYRQALLFQEKVLGKEHPDTLMSRNNLASSLLRQGKYLEAEAMYRQTLLLREKVLGKEHPDTLGSMMGLAASLNQQGKSIEAEAMYRQTLLFLEKVLGKEHPHTLGSRYNLALSLLRQGKYLGAEAIFRQTLLLREKVIGKEHPDTLGSMMGLATSLNLQGKSIEAEAMYRQTLLLREQVIGKEHTDTLSSRINLATLLDQLGRFTEAEAMHRQTLQLREKVLGKEHPDTLTSRNNLVVSLNRQRKVTEAAANNRQMLQLQEKISRKEPVDTPRSKKTRPRA